MTANKFDIQSLPLSVSVQRAIGQISPNERIRAWDIVSQILKLHPEYARGMGGKILEGNRPPSNDLRTVDDWFEGLSRLYDLDMVKRKVEVINGQLAIWGLAQLDPGLGSHLNSSGFLSVLEDEYKEEKKIPPNELLQRSNPDLQTQYTSINPSNQIEQAKEMIDNYQSYPRKLKSSSIEVVLGSIRAIDNGIEKARLYTALLPMVPLGLTQSVAVETLASIRMVDDEKERMKLLAEIQHYLPTSTRYEVAEELRKYSPSKKQKTVSSSKSSKRLVQYSPPIAGYTSDIANQEAPDLLDIEREVANIANVLTFKQVNPPLALGLFGDWGSGKTFFMGKLRKYVSQIANHYQKEEERTETDSLWCSRVAQIEFNAWHFSDSNLWASLVTRIYEGLDRELNNEKETADDIKKKILAQIKEANENSIKAKSQLDLAKTQVDSAEEDLDIKRKEREGKENKLMGLIGSIPDLLKGTEFDKPLEDATTLLGVPEAAKTIEALEELNGELKSLSGKLTAVTTRALHSPWTLVGMAIFVVVLPVLFTSAIERWGTSLSEAGKRVAEVSTFLLVIVGWLQDQVRRGLGLVKTVDSALQQARKTRQTKIENDKDVIKAQKELTEAQVKEQAARTNLEMAQTELQRLQDELQELRPERKLQRLIETRASTGAYAQHLGIISLIRSDFESMSRILAEMADERRDFKKDPPIRRIILYIDDLDRCKPERVVEILEAIHLLLYFPLFVVVVAVDPRWLRHSLAQHYPATLNEHGGTVLADGHTGMSLYSTPQDYLEKIFQIPFALRPIEKGGYQSLVNNLLKPLPPTEMQRMKEQAETKPAPEELQAPEIGKALAIDQKTKNDSGKPGQELPQQDTPKVEQGKDREEKPFTPIPPRQLEFTKWEQEDIQQLWLMFRTPRTVKRFINIYRLLRAGLVSDSDVKSFEGTKQKPGEYQVALLLLAAITTFPNESNRLLYRLDAWLDIQELNKNRRMSTWKEVIGFLSAESEVTEKKESITSRKKNQDIKTNEQLSKQIIDNDLNTSQTEAAQGSEDSWHFMLDCLDRITQISKWKKPFKLTTLRAWVLRVARFSFSVQPT